jgi:hypothetical protein
MDQWQPARHVLVHNTAPTNKHNNQQSTTCGEGNHDVGGATDTSGTRLAILKRAVLGSSQQCFIVDDVQLPSSL